MIGYLTGTIQKKLAKNLILNVEKVGYLVHVPAPLLEEVKEKQELELYIHTKVREDDISLYGFKSFAELEFFKLILGVNGIGPKLGLEIISHAPDKVQIAILQNDIIFLSKIPGIGKKTAERLVVELKNKINLGDISHLSATNETSQNNDAISALETLGYQKFEIIKILKKIPKDITETEEIITYFLRNV
jgi:Holliday junction DNA helicase RuvA